MCHTLSHAPKAICSAVLSAQGIRTGPRHCPWAAHRPREMGLAGESPAGRRDSGGTSLPTANSVASHQAIGKRLLVSEVLMAFRRFREASHGDVHCGLSR